MAPSGLAFGKTEDRLRGMQDDMREASRISLRFIQATVEFARQRVIWGAFGVSR
jgi:hypothetical protein